MSKRTKEELEAIAILEQFTAAPPVIAKPTQKKVEPAIVKEAPPTPKKAVKTKTKSVAGAAPAPTVKAKRPPNIVWQKFTELGWMAKGMVVLIILGIIVEIIKKL